jgi:hypothetical protein
MRNWRFVWWRARGKIARAKGVGKVAGEVVSEAEGMFGVVEGYPLIPADEGNPPSLKLQRTSMIGYIVT